MSNNLKLNLPKIIAIIGTTASGKTKLGVAMASKFNGEIISADSRQVYKNMDIGTGKDLKDYSIKKWWGKRKDIPYHLIDVVSPKDQFSLADFQRLAYKTIDDILKREKLPIIVGGTGLYAQALVDGYELSKVGQNKKLRDEMEKLSVGQIFEKIKERDLEFASKINNSDRGNKIRLIRYWEILNSGEKEISCFSPKFKALILGVTHPKEKLNQQILKRLDQRLEKEGMIDEVKKLINQGVSYERLNSFGLEYRWISRYLKNEINYQTMRDNLYIDIRKFAKRQLTWLRRWERQGQLIHWIASKRKASSLVKKFLKNKNA